MMKANIDLRYAVPPLISLCFIFLLLDRDPLSTFQPSVKTAFLLVIAIVIFIFLFISIKICVCVAVAADAIRLQAGDFSVPVAILLLCSIFLPWSHFLIAYFIIVGFCSSPLYCSLSNMLKRFIFWFYNNLQTIPTLYIIWFTQQQENAEQPPSPPQTEIEMVEIEGNHLQPTLEQDFTVVIDE